MLYGPESGTKLFVRRIKTWLVSCGTKWSNRYTLLVRDTELLVHIAKTQITEILIVAYPLMSQNRTRDICGIGKILSTGNLHFCSQKCIEELPPLLWKSQGTDITTWCVALRMLKTEYRRTYKIKIRFTYRKKNKSEIDAFYKWYWMIPHEGATFCSSIYRNDSTNLDRNEKNEKNVLSDFFSAVLTQRLKP